MRLLARALYVAGLLTTSFTFLSCVMWLSRADAPKNTTVYGDLSHLQYTATGPLSAAFVFPSNGFASPTIALRFVLSTVRDAGVELQVNDEVIPSTKIGKRVVVVKSGLTQYEYYGVVLRAGPNDVVITPLGANGSRGPSQQAIIYGPGAPASIHAEFEHPLVADGRTPQNLLITALDRWGHPAQPGSEVHVSIAQGNARFSAPQSASVAVPGMPQTVVETPTPYPSNAPIAPGDQTAETDPARRSDVSLDVGGSASLPILPGMLAGDMRVRMTSGDVEQTQSFFIEPYLRKAFVNGIVSAGAGAVPITVDGDGVQDEGGARRGRLALFAQGAVGKRTSLTLAYESQNRLAPVSSYGPYVDDPNERPYLTYGDSSTQTSDFHSNSRLFARLDSGRSNATWGQFNADITDASGIGSFHDLLSGAKAEYAIPGGSAKATIFSAHNTTAYVSMALPASGLSMLSQPLHADIVVGSDYLTLVSIDRHTGAVVTQTPLVRNVDYTIDYATGVLRFINVPLPFDDAFNPQSVLVQYAYQGPSTASQTTGGEVHVEFGKDQVTRLQIGYVNDSTGAGNFALWSQTLTGQMNGGGWTLSHASSGGAVPGLTTSTLANGNGGSALAFQYGRRTGSDQTALSYTSTSAGFGNPFGGLSVPGFTAYRAAWTHTDPRRNDLTLEMDGQINHGAGVSDSQRSETISWRHAIGSAASMLLGISSHTQNNVAASGLSTVTSAASPVPVLPGTNGTTTQAVAGVDVRATSRVSLAVQHSMTLTGNSQNSTQPDETTAQITYDMDKRGRVFVRELLSGTPVASFAQASSDLTVGAMATRSTAIGVERVVGSDTTVSSEYLVNHTGNGENIYSALGVQQKIKISSQMAGNFFVQSANATGEGAGGFTVSGFSLAYSNNDRMRGGLAFQTRGGLGGGNTINAGLAGALSPNVSAVAAIQQASAGGVTSADDKFSLAYRPDQNDRFISLFGWDRLSGTGAITVGAKTDVVSFEEFWRPGGGIEIAGRTAYKLDGDGTYIAHTSLFGLRLRKNVGKRADVGGEFRALAVPGIAGARSTDFAAEAGYRIGEGTRAAAGYSFRGSIDPTLTGQTTHRGFYFTLTTMVDRIFGWGNSK